MPENYVNNLEKRLQKSFNHVSRDVRFLYRQQLDQVNRIQKCEKRVFWLSVGIGILLYDKVKNWLNSDKKPDEEDIKEVEKLLK